VDAFPAERWRCDFPILERRIAGRPLVYLDSAATTQKPRPVLDAMRVFAERSYANVHRGVHTLACEATLAFEAARARVAAFIGAADAAEVVFVRGATEAINLVSASWGRTNLREGDEIVLSALEHHSNIVPWQMLRAQTGAVIKVAPVDDCGGLHLDDFARLLTDRTRLVAITHVSNVLGTIVPIADIVRLAHAAGALVLVDGCQAVAHMQVDVKGLGADFYVFSAHKMYGPTGIGVLWGRGEILEGMPPYQGGGEMILNVSFERSTFKRPPHRFEAGTPAIVEAIGLGAAIDYLTVVDVERANRHERALAEMAEERLAEIEGVRVLGSAAEKTGILSFVMSGVHPHDIATVVDRSGVAIRAGHHCAQPLMQRLGAPATARASFALFNTAADVDALAAAIREVREMFR
jgi:cysteine desulfurase/selenocysteine lyase